MGSSPQCNQCGDAINSGWARDSETLCDVCLKKIIEEEQDICGLCGLPGADKYAHPIHWPGEAIPDGPLVHVECEEEETRRACATLTDEERIAFLRTI